MVPQEGLEPPTLTLEPSCSNPLSYWGKMVRVARIELASLAWKAGILAIIRHPLVHICFNNRGDYSTKKITCQNANK